MADALLGGIVINEILVDPNGVNNFDTDGNGTAHETDEYIELYNNSGSAIDISGLELWDHGVGHWFTFPPGTTLESGAHAMVMTGLQATGSFPTGAADDLFFEAGRGSALINNGGDNVTVYDPSNDEFIQATYNGDSLDDPTAGAGGYSGFSGTATRNGSGEDFGNDTDGFSLQRTGDGADTFDSEGPTPGTTNVCFADGTLILTPTGMRRIEDLAPGDLVCTMDNGAKPIIWMLRKTWTAAQIAASPNLAPVVIEKGAMGPELPTSDLRLSQQHRVMIRGKIAQRMYGEPEVLVPAALLLGMDGVRIDVPDTDVSYFHLMLDQHEVVVSNGLATESLYLGRQAVKSISEPALAEIEFALGLPKSCLASGLFSAHPIRQLAIGKQAKNLIGRHIRNRKPMADRNHTHYRNLAYEKGQRMCAGL